MNPTFNDEKLMPVMPRMIFRSPDGRMALATRRMDISHLTVDELDNVMGWIEYLNLYIFRGMRLYLDVKAKEGKTYLCME